MITTPLERNMWYAASQDGLQNGKRSICESHRKARFRQNGEHKKERIGSKLLACIAIYITRLVKANFTSLFAVVPRRSQLKHFRINLTPGVPFLGPVHSSYGLCFKCWKANYSLCENGLCDECRDAMDTQRLRLLNILMDIRGYGCNGQQKEQQQQQYQQVLVLLQPKV